MELTNEFTVPASIDQVWALLLDVEKVAPCMPGAALTSYDGEAFTGNVKVKLGPVNLTYAGKGRFTSRDAETHRVVIEASGKDTRGKGTAAATITGTMQPEGTGTKVQVVTDLRITGAPAQFGRGMIGEVSKRLIDQFANCLATTLAVAPSPAAAAEAPSAEPPIEILPAQAQAPSAETPLPAATAPPPSSQPIDLLAVTGVSAGFKRAMPYVIAVVAGLVLVAVIIAFTR